MFSWLKRSSATPHGGPDYSSVNSREKAEALVGRGELQKLLLLPAEFGGADVQPNTVYVPPFAADLKSETDINTVLPLSQKGVVTRYRATPEYQGKSFIPVSITIVASEPGSFTSTINIWGKALNANSVQA